MFSSFTSLSSILASPPPSEITINSSAVKSLSGTGTYDISEDGQCIGIVNSSNQYYLSINGGQTFKFKGTLPTSISTFHMSDNGKFMIAQQTIWGNKTVYYSTDYGVNWSQREISQGSVLPTGMLADGKYAIISGDNPGWNQNGKSNVFVSNDNMASWSDTWYTPISVTENLTVVPNTNIYVYANGGFIDRQNGQNILISSSNSISPAKPTNLQYYSSTNGGSLFTFTTVPSTNAPYGRRAYVNGSCIILTTTTPNAIYVSTNSGSSFTKASTTVLYEVNYPNILHWNDNHIISNADGTKIYYVYNNHIYVSTDKLLTSSVYASNVSNEINSDGNLMGIVKASSTGKYMLTWNNGLIITTNNLI